MTETRPRKCIHCLSQSEAPRRKLPSSPIGLFKNRRKHGTTHLNAQYCAVTLTEFELEDDTRLLFVDFSFLCVYLKRDRNDIFIGVEDKSNLAYSGLYVKTPSIKVSLIIEHWNGNVIVEKATLKDAFLVF